MNRLTRLIVGICLALAPAAESAETMSHSGTITAVDRAARTIQLGEVGPWRVKGGVTAKSSWSPWTVRVGAFATVLCQHDGKFLTALEIVVTELEDR